MTDDAGRAERRARLLLAGVIALGVLLRLAVARAQGFPTDVGTFEAWAERLASVGPGRFYEPGYFSDYPPAFLYVLWLLGAFLDGEPLRLAIKAISVPADIAIALLAARLLWSFAGRAYGIAAAAIWMLQPGPIFAGPYWGQVDAIGTVPVLGSLLAAGARRWWLAGVLGAIAALVKPQFGVALFIVVAAALIEFVREARWRPSAQAVGAAAATAYVVSIPFWGPDPTRIVGEIFALVRSAAETYPYTSLYAFNPWSIFYDFWQPDGALVVFGALALVAGLIAACIPLWWRRDTAILLACGAFAAMAFYFLPTRAHERYLFPAFALALPFAAARARVFVPYAVLAVAFAVSLYFAFTRYQQYVDLRVPAFVEATLFSRAGQIAIALLMIGAAAYLVWRLVRSDARLEADATWAVRVPLAPRASWTLPAGLGPGRLPTRRDLTIAFLVALAVLVTRGYRLDWPREMYFDEVYHARTAFELLAQREPYEWTHPHLAKEIMALGILALGDDRVVGHEPALPQGAPTAFVVSNDGTRAYVTNDFEVVVQARGGSPRGRALGVPARALAIRGDHVIAMTDTTLAVVPFAEVPSNTPIQQVTLPFAGATSLSVAGDQVVVGGAQGIAVYPSLDATPQVIVQPTVALTEKPDGSEIFALDPQGVVHDIAVDTLTEKRALTGGQIGTAIAFVAPSLSSDRIFVARADAPVVDTWDLETGGHDQVRLSNARTGTVAAATALASVPRTQFVYALAGGQLVVIEPRGGSAFASIGVTGRFLGVDGEADKLVVAGPAGADLVETGRNALAWRLPGVLFAAMLAFFLVLLARRLFASAILPALVGVVVLAESSMYAQARIGMNDIYVGALIVAGWYFVVAAYRPRGSAVRDILIAGLLFGLAAAAKWAAFYAIAGLALATIAVTAWAYERGRPGTGGPLDLLAGRGRNAALLFASFAIIPTAIYLGSYLPWYGGPTIPYGWNIVELTQQMYWYHSGLTAPHPAGSPWWSWPLVLKPVYWYLGQASDGENGYIYDAGNVVLFWGGIVAFAWCTIAAVRARSLGLGFVVFAALVQYVAWIPIGRVLFFYHFFTVLPFYLLALSAGLVYWWERGRERIVVGYLAVAVAAFAYFYPFVSGQPFPGAQAGMFFILPTWTYDCQFYPTFVCNPQIGSSFSPTMLFGRLALSLAVAGGAAIVFFIVAPKTLARLLPSASSPPRRLR